MSDEPEPTPEKHGRKTDHGIDHETMAVIVGVIASGLLVFYRVNTQPLTYQECVSLLWIPILGVGVSHIGWGVLKFVIGFEQR